MEQFEKVEKLREKTGVSYEDAKKALEEHDWDMLEAIVALENEETGSIHLYYGTFREWRV